MDRHTSQTPPKGEISRSFDQHRDSQETQTRFLPMRNLRYLEGSSRDRVDRANQYLRTLNDDHDTSMSIAKYLRDKNRFTEQDITRIQNFIHMAFQHKSNKDANQGVEAIMNLNYPNDAALEATINWFAEGAPGSVSERETIEQQYKKFQEKKDTDKGVKDAFNGLRRYIATAKGEKDYDEKIRIIAEKAQKYLYEAVGTDRDIRFKDLFGEKSEIPNHIHPAYALEEYFSLIKRFDTRTNIGEYSQKLRDLLK